MEGTAHELPEESVLLFCCYTPGCKADVLPSAAGRAATLSLDAGILGLALPVAFGCHGSRKMGRNRNTWKTDAET